MYSFVYPIQNSMIFYCMSAKSELLKNNDSKWLYSKKHCHYIDKLSREYNISSIYVLWHRRWSDIMIHEVCHWFLLHIREYRLSLTQNVLTSTFFSLILLWFLFLLLQSVPCRQIKTIYYILNVIFACTLASNNLPWFWRFPEEN